MFIAIPGRSGSSRLDASVSAYYATYKATQMSIILRNSDVSLSSLRPRRVGRDRFMVSVIARLNRAIQ